MTIQLKRNQENRISEALRSSAYSSADDVVDRALEVLHEQDEWLLSNREAIDARIREAIEELDRGQGVPPKSLMLILQG